MRNILISVFGIVVVVVLDAPFWLLLAQVLLLFIVLYVEFKKLKLEIDLEICKDLKKKQRLKELNPYKWGN